MKQQIVAIHGGETFDTYQNYISYLKNKIIEPERLKPKRDWKNTLLEKLGENFEVLLPSMPNKTNSQFKEWKIWFERITPFIKKNTIFVGHSLGGTFLAKYLSQNTISKSIRAVILVAAPFDDADSKYSLASFKLPPSLKKFSEQADKIYLIHSKDDFVVPFEDLKKYKKALPDAEIMVFDHKEHFSQETFPEIVKLIKTL
jgi:predicted alpha/beta hydrolase family esterase